MNRAEARVISKIAVTWSSRRLLEFSGLENTVGPPFINATATAGNVPVVFFATTGEYRFVALLFDRPRFTIRPGVLRNVSHEAYCFVGWVRELGRKFQEASPLDFDRAQRRKRKEFNYLFIECLSVESTMIGMGIILCEKKKKKRRNRSKVKNKGFSFDMSLSRKSSLKIYIYILVCLVHSI